MYVRRATSARFCRSDWLRMDRTEGRSISLCTRKRLQYQYGLLDTWNLRCTAHSQLCQFYRAGRLMYLIIQIEDMAVSSYEWWHTQFSHFDCCHIALKRHRRRRQHIQTLWWSCFRWKFICFAIVRVKFSVNMLTVHSQQQLVIAKEVPRFL